MEKSKTLSVNYNGFKVDENLDRKITKFFESIGMKWYAQGFDLKKGIRDINFDYK